MTSPREDYPFYIGTSDDDIQAMLKELGLNKLEDLYSHIDPEFLLDEMKLPKHLEATQLKTHMQEVANKNKKMISFLGDGLQNFSIPKIVEKVCGIRGLTTAYTPYQPERSQGNL
jgi:glycine dehydrogenase